VTWWPGDPKHVDVTLQRWEVELCREEAAARNARALKNGYRAGFGTAEQVAQGDLTGALGELATSNYVDIETNFGGDYFEQVHDVGLIEVRTLGLGKSYGLPGWKTDEPKVFFVYARLLRLDEIAVVRLEGWINVEQFFSYAKPHAHWKHKTKGPTLLLDPNYLQAMTTLKRNHLLAERFYT